MNLSPGLRTLRSLLLCSYVLVIVGCSYGDVNVENKAFMAEVQAKPKGKIAPLPEFESYQAFTYGAANLRSPFEPPVVAQPKSAEQRKNVGVKPPKNHVREYLERFALSSLSMVGTLQQSNETWALVQDDSGGVHRVQVGDFMGSQWGQIESIDDARIDITEIVSDGAGGWLRRPRSIELKGLE
jgi:type IV pilus assembly protein PilP